MSATSISSDINTSIPITHKRVTVCVRDVGNFENIMIPSNLIDTTLTNISNHEISDILKKKRNKRNIELEEKEIDTLFREYPYIKNTLILRRLFQEYDWSKYLTRISTIRVNKMSNSYKMSGLKYLMSEIFNPAYTKSVIYITL